MPAIQRLALFMLIKEQYVTLKEKEIVMKATIIKSIIALLGAGAASAFAATTNLAGEGSGPLTWFFIGFGVMVIMLQAVPALILFASMLKGLFATSEKEITIPKA
jgi:hypothetical protein